jgi:hypothetical protein
MIIRVPGFTQAHRYWLLVAVVALASVLLVGCGGGDDDDPSGDSGDGGSATTEPTSSTGGDGGGSSGDGEIDACSILLPEDVEAEIGVVPEPDNQPVGPFQSCGYFDSLTNFVQFQVCRCLSGSQFDDSAKAGADVLEIELKEIDGIGDKAYWFGGILWVQRGDIAFNLWISKAAYFEDDGTALEGEALDEVSLPDTQALAEKLLSRLP